MLGSTNYMEDCLIAKPHQPSMEVFLLLLTRLCLLTFLEEHTASFKIFQQSEQVSGASPPANVHLVMTVLTLLFGCYEETISYLVPRVVLHAFQNSFSPQCRC